MTVINPKSISGINSITTGSGSDDLLTIHNNSGAERLRIDGSGNTRITSGIVTTLSIGAVSSIGDITGDVSIADKIIHTGDTDTALRFPTANTFTVETGGSERIRVTSDGYFGVGGTPTTKVGVTLAAQAADGTDDGADWGAGGIFQLNASGDAAAGNEILLAGAHSGGLAQVASGIGFGRHNTSDWGTYLSFKTHAADTSNIDSVVERMRINSVGKVGINSTAPDGTLAIEAAVASSPVLTMRNHPAAGVYTNNYGVEYRHAYNAVNHGMLVHTQEAANGRRTLDVSDSNGVFATFTNGKVGIKSDSPAVQLNVTGEARVQASGDSTSYVNIKNNQIYMDANGTGYLDVAHVGGDLQVRTSTSSALDTTGPTFKSNGNIAFANGKGIDFSATADGSGGQSVGEVLDDYEKGDFTATCANSVTLEPTADSCSYIKVGNLCHVQGQIRIDSSNSNSDMRITNLPFTASNPTDTGGHTVGAVRIYNIDCDNNGIGPFCIIYDGLTEMQFRISRDNSTDTYLQAKDGGYFAFGITYRTT